MSANGRIAQGVEKEPAFRPTPNHLSRTISGLLLAAHRHADFVVTEAGKIMVPSASEDELFYMVDLDQTPYGFCPCPSFNFGSRAHRVLDKHIVAADFVTDFREAAPGVSFKVEADYDSRLGKGMFYVAEYLHGEPEGLFHSARERFDSALWDVLELMQGRIGSPA